MSTKPHERKLGNGDELIGTGDRVVKLGFATINIYSLGLYVDPDACRTSLASEFGRLDHDGLLRESATFYPSLVNGKFRKTFRFIFCRSIGRDRLVGGFAGPLRARVDEAHTPDAEVLLSHLVPKVGVADEDVLTVLCDADGRTVSAKYRTAATGVEEELLEIESGGEGGAWVAFQNLFFDPETHIPTIRHGAVAELPDVLVEQAGEEEEEMDGDGVNGGSVRRMAEPTEEDIEAAVEESYEKAGTMAARTWSEFAGRNKGRDRYKCGDVTLGIVTALGARKPKQAAKSRDVPLASTSSFSDKSKGKDAAAELTALKQRLLEVEAVNKKLDSELQRTDDLLVMTERRLPVTVTCAVIATEVLGLICVCVTNLSATHLSCGKLILHVAAAGLIIIWAHYGRKARKSKTA